MSESVEPRRRGRPKTIMAPKTDRLTELNNRERSLALKAAARHRYTFDLPLELYEQLLDQAEAWGQPLPDVVRACLRKGLEHISRFGGAEANPYISGSLTPPRQSQLDPSGIAWPPTAPNGISAAPASDWGAIPYDARFESPKLKPGMLPSGATIDTSTDAPSHSVRPFIPDDE